jgi:hypothetical protein
VNEPQEDPRKLFEEVHELTAASLHGLATPEEMMRLDRLLCQDPQARRLYVRYVDVSCNLRQWASHPLAETLESGRPAQEAAPPPGLFGFLGDVGHQGWGFFADHSRMFSLLAVVLAFGSLAALVGLAIHGGQRVEQASIATAPVARLTRATGCRWNGPQVGFSPGAELAAGQELELAAGEAEIAFRSGAVVVVRGPSILKIESDKRARLLVGRVTARAETEQSHGFILSTQTTCVTDLGTEFHVQAAADGHSEIHVTSGAVEIQTVKHRARHRLEVGDTAQVEPGDAGVFAVIESGSGTPDFKFPTIEPPSNRDYAGLSQHHATIRIAEGALSIDSGRAERLLDGAGQSKADSPGESCFFGNNQKGRIVLDLGKAVRVRKVNTYSWHKYEQVPSEHDRYDVRATQRYNLFGYAGSSPPPTEGDPAAHGWTLISRVNTDDFFSVPPLRNRPEQQAVSITAAEGDVGCYQFLLWDVRPTHVNAFPPHGETDQNTFFGEFDVYAEELP